MEVITRRPTGRKTPPFGEWPGGRTGVAYWLHVASEMEFAHPCSGATFAFCKIINWGDVFLLGNFRTLPGELKARPVLRTKSSFQNFDYGNSPAGQYWEANTHTSLEVRTSGNLLRGFKGILIT